MKVFRREIANFRRDRSATLCFFAALSWMLTGTKTENEQGV
jgi:hypothetical protein